MFFVYLKEFVTDAECELSALAPMENGKLCCSLQKQLSLNRYISCTTMLKILVRYIQTTDHDYEL